MPRRARSAPSGATFHVVNRGNDRQRLFFEDADYRAFLQLMDRAPVRASVKVFSICIMPNHFHALVRPEVDGAMSAYLKWVQCCYACYFRSRTRSVGNGHVFQRRFWSDQIRDDYHFLTALRYIESNPVAGKLVESIDDWPWSSATLRHTSDHVLDKLPIPLPPNWLNVEGTDANEPIQM